MEDKPADTQLMRQGEEIDQVYLIVDGLVVVEEEKKVAVQKAVSDTRSSGSVASTVSGLVSSSSPSLLSYVFGSAGDNRVHGLMADHSGDAGVVTHTATDTSTVTTQHRPLLTAADLRKPQPISPSATGSGGDALNSHQSGSPSLVPVPASSEGGLVHAVREAAQRGVQVLDQLTGLHQPAQHVASLLEPTETEQQHQYQQTHAHHNPHSAQATHEKGATQQYRTLSTAPPITSTSEHNTAAASAGSPPTSATIMTPLPVRSATAAPLFDTSTGEPAGSAVAHSPSTHAENEREGKRQQRRAKREKKRREKQSGSDGQLGSSGLPSTLVSVSPDGSYEIRRETIGYMRSGRLVGEMSLLTTTAPTATAKTRNRDDTETTRDSGAALITATAAASSSSSANTSSSVSPALATASASSSPSFLSSLPSPSDLLSSTSIASSSPTIASASVTCVEPCRVLVWRREALRTLFFRFPSLSVGWHAVVSSDLLARLSEARHLSLHTGYRLLLLGICAEGSVTSKQRSAADEYRRLNGISDDDHQRTLTDLGWTTSEWQKGSKKQLSWIDTLRAGLPAARRASL